MKAFKLTIIMLALTVGLSSCFDSFLEEKVYDFLAPENFYKTDEDAIAALNGMYNVLVQDNQSYQRALYMLGEYPSEATTAFASGDPYRTEFEKYTWSATSGGIDIIWLNLYRGINRANLLIEKLPGMTGNEATLSRSKGEAHFLRAYYYFTLMRIWDHIPLITTSEQKDYNASNENTDDAVRALIIEDLKIAEQALPESYDALNTGRATQGAAKAILAKTYLTMAGYPWLQNDKWALAAAKCEELMGGRYSLEEKYADVFKEVNEHGNEYIFSAEFKAGIVASNFVNITGIRGEAQQKKFGGWSSVLALKPFYDNVMTKNQGDLRIPTVFVISFVNADGELRTWGIDFNTDRSQPHTNKYQDTDESGTGDMASSLNLHLIRYADVLLMHSEAINNGAASSRYNKVYGLNEVRKRAGLASIPESISKEAMQDALVWERVVEFSFEGQAWFDYKRMEQIEKRTALKGLNNVNKKYYAFPIPQNEINRNPNLKQHPLWQ